MGYLQPASGGQGSIITMPRLRDASDDVRAAWAQAASRSIAMIHNNGWIAGVIDAVIALMIGTGLRSNVKPNGAMLGWDAKQSSDWARLVERRYEAWGKRAYRCDAGARYTLGQLQAAAIRQWFATGEIVGELPWIARAGSANGTKVRLLPSHWLSQKSDSLNRLVQGVRLDGHGAPASYLFNLKDRFGIGREVEMRARDGFGRPRVVHIFDGAAGQVRGITPLAPVLRVLRDYDQLSNATLTAAMIQAVFAATIESDYPSTDVMDALRDSEEAADATAFDAFMAQKAGWHEHVDIDLGRNGKIAHLMTGERLKLHANQHPNSTYEAFANFLLREIARCLGVMLHDLTGDFRGETYSSVRMAIAKNWPLMEYRRSHIAGAFMQPIFDAWLEAEIDAGSIPFPGGIDRYVAARDEICEVDWRGPAKPQADDAKAARAHETYYKLGVLTQEQIANDLGHDHEDVHDQLQRERQSREAHDLPEPIDALNGGRSTDDREVVSDDAD